MGMLNVHSRPINGNLAYWTTRRDKIIDAIGPTVRKFDEDFIAPALASSLLAGWTNTAVEAGTGSSTHIVQDVLGGVLRWNAAANENDGLNSQAGGESFLLASSKPLYFGCRWAITEKTQSDAFIGLSATDTTICAGIDDDVVGFATHDGDANLDYQVRKSGTGAAVDTAVDLVDSTYVVTEFFFDGTDIAIYVDDTLIATVATNIPDDELLQPSIAYLNGTGSMQHDGLLVDWIRVIQFN